MRAKFFIWFLALLAIWWLIQIPAVFDPLMLFLTLGVNPFTGRDIAPIVMAELLGGVLLLSVLILFRKELRRGMRRITRRRQEKKAAPAVAAMPVGLPAVAVPVPLFTPNVAVDYDARQGAIVPKAGLQPLPALPAAPAARRIQPSAAAASAPVRRKKSSRVRQAVRAGRRRSRLARAAALTAAVLTGHRMFAWWKQRGLPAIRTGAAATARFVVRAVQWVLLVIVQTWLYCEPYCRRFDKWLERKMHQYETTAALVSLGREMEIVARRSVSEIRAWRSNPVVLDLLRTLRK